MAWTGGSTRAWRKTRARVLLRDGYRCQVGLPGCLGVADQVHHKIGRGVSERDEDLCAACSPCNSRAGDPAKGKDPEPTPRTAW